MHLQRNATQRNATQRNATQRNANQNYILLLTNNFKFYLSQFFIEQKFSHNYFVKFFKHGEIL